tara:strand:+ start:189538 stop:191562 length:2025 start_codon:yes stop_codon:yes gene_type:complete
MSFSSKLYRIIFLLNTICLPLTAQVHDTSWRQIIQNNDKTWFASNEAKQVAENVLLYQRDIGGWPKNIQMQKPLSGKEVKELVLLKSDPTECTTDNGATYQQLIFLSKIYKQIPDERYKKSFLSGLNYILEAQYENGGWPQFYPLKKGYYSHITYNDDSMVHILKILREIKDETGYFSIQPSTAIIEKCKTAFDKGISCILKTQYIQNGVLTSWCAQHDEITLQPAKARAYELPSLSGKESAQIVLLLMSIKNPSQDIINAVDHAVSWFEKVKIIGLREERTFDENTNTRDKKIVLDATSPPMWARFMDLETNTPFFCDRDGIRMSSLAEIGDERRNGYAWYTQEPLEILSKYPSWKSDLKKESPKAPKEAYNMVVAKDGSGDFTTIQEAIYASKAFPYPRVIIHIKNGVYNEKVHIYSWNTRISLIGEDKNKTIITYDDYFDKIDLGRNSTFHTPTLLVEGNDFYATNLTIKNMAGEVGQAVALSVNANRVAIENCILKGNQDTLYTSGEGFKHYFKNCYIEGTTDFIFGEATVVFENCTIHSKANSYITAASTPKGTDFGYVFMNCKLTADKQVKEVYLGRPWRTYAQTVFINCTMANHILPIGWNNWSNKDAEKETFYAEYNSNGEGFNPNKRASWSHQLTKSQAKNYTIKNILGDTQNPENLQWYLNLNK